MNLFEFSSEVSEAKNRFAEKLDVIFREANEALDAAHAECQERIYRAKTALLGEPVQVDGGKIV